MQSLLATSFLYLLSISEATRCVAQRSQFIQLNSPHCAPPHLCFHPKYTKENMVHESTFKWTRLNATHNYSLIITSTVSTDTNYSLPFSVRKKEGAFIFTHTDTHTMLSRSYWSIRHFYLLLWNSSWQMLQLQEPSGGTVSGGVKQYMW